jgi:hypothetical protein
MRQWPLIHSFQASGGQPAAEDTQKTISGRLLAKTRRGTAPAHGALQPQHGFYEPLPRRLAKPRFGGEDCQLARLPAIAALGLAFRIAARLATRGRRRNCRATSCRRRRDGGQPLHGRRRRHACGMTSKRRLQRLGVDALQNEPQPGVGRRLRQSEPEGFVETLAMDANELMHLPIGIGAGDHGEERVEKHRADDDLVGGALRGNAARRDCPSLTGLRENHFLGPIFPREYFP